MPSSPRGSPHGGGYGVLKAGGVAHPWGVLGTTGVAVGLHGCGAAGKRVVRWTPALLK
jgi:hypothetical protein